ncbi:MAG: TetR/AcrR family transcriptional regulator [Streptosporangiaceae bacterium]
MTRQEAARRPGGRSALVRARVHQAVAELLAERGSAGLTIPAVAQRADVNPTSIYRRWHTCEGLIADVAMTLLERDHPLPDTGNLRTDLTAWATSVAADLARPEGRMILLALSASIPGTPEARAERNQHLQRRIRGIMQIADRAADRGENPPDAGAIADAILGPLYLRALWGVLPADPGYPQSLVDRLLSASSAENAIP